MTAPKPPRRGALFWALVPVGLLGSMLGMHVFLLTGVLDDPSFSVEADYYQKAVSWDVKMAQDRENARLGWTTRVEVLGAAASGRVTVRLAGTDGKPIERARVNVEAFHNARASRVLATSLEETSPGVYAGPLAVDRPGLWELRLVAERGSDRFTEVVRRDIAGERAP